MDFEIYRDKRRKFRWRVTASNGEIVGASSQGFVRKKDCNRNGEKLARALRSYFWMKG